MASPRLGVVSSVQLAEGSWGHWLTAPPAPPPPTTGTVGGGHVDTTHCPLRVGDACSRLKTTLALGRVARGQDESRPMRAGGVIHIDVDFEAQTSYSRI